MVCNAVGTGVASGRLPAGRGVTEGGGGSGVSEGVTVGAGMVMNSVAVAVGVMEGVSVNVGEE